VTTLIAGTVSAFVASLYALPDSEPVGVRVAPRLASWMANGHPDQVRPSGDSSTTPKRRSAPVSPCSTVVSHHDSTSDCHQT
jgi:hypothetical protein